MTVEQRIHEGRIRIPVRPILGICALALAAEIIIPPLLNIKHTTQVLSAVGGTIQECSNRDTVQTGVFPYDAIFVLGGGAIRVGKGVYELSDATKIRLDATAKAYKDGWSDRIFIIYGEMGPGEEHIVVDYLQSEYNRLTEDKQVIPAGKIHVEKKSKTTDQNIKAIAKILAEFGIEFPVMITDKIHMPRAKKKACEEFSISSATAEDIINGYSPSKAESIRTIQRSKIPSDREKREALLLLLKIWDNNGKVIDFLSEIEGPHWR